ncbi:tetratricopeptide repeat protein [Kitasatospora kazusensis]|uniref:tetratricopeptide repeat protein n=1 Tax=Kitasatospora kazusensis TaxID=407974 RepID=UPI0031E2732D
MGGRLVLTSAHVVTRKGEGTVAAGERRRVEVFHPGSPPGRADRPAPGGTVVWCGTAGGRDDAALVLVDEDERWRAPAGAVRWGRMVTDRPGVGCETWGVPDVAQREDRPVDAAQLRGEVNPGSGFVGNGYVLDLHQHPPQWSQAAGSPWGGLSGAAALCDRLLVGVVASDRAYSGGGQLNLVPAYVLHHDPGFRACLAAHGAAPAGLEAVELQHLDDTGAAPGRLGAGVRSPAALLQAGRQTVPFHGRRQLLEELTAWCARDGFGAWLVHGPGGQGKTRLAHRLGELLAADGWAVLWPRADASPDQLHELRHAAKPLLVVLDYAETRPRQLTALVEAAAEHPGSTPFKVLLLARTAGDWWRQAATATGLAQEFLDHAPVHLLAPLEDDPDHRPAAYREAAAALAAALPRVEGLAAHDWPGAAAGLPLPARLDQAAYGNALTLQMTALADLLDTGTGTGPTGPAGPGATVHAQVQDVEDRLLGHEHRYWQRTAAARGLTPAVSADTLETVLAAAHLAGADDREHADRLWCLLPALADRSRDRRNTVTGWLSALYPAPAPLPWGTLQPDRLAERHIGRVLDTDPALADHLLAGADDTQAARLLTVYSRAAAHPVFHDRLDAQLTALCGRHRRRLDGVIITTATRTDHPAPLIAALDAAVTAAATPLDDLITLNGRLPPHSRRLAGTSLRLVQTVTDRHRALAGTDPDTYLPDLAVSLNNLAVRLGEVGRHEEGLAAIREAVEIRRALAEADPGRLPGLAGSLSNLSVRLAETGRHEEGLAAVREAAHYYQVLAEADPDAYLPEFALCLNNLSNRLGAVGRHEEGLAASGEAAHHYRTLAEADPDAYLPDLALSLNNLSNRLGEVGRHEESLSAIREAAHHYRVLAEADPDAYLPNLAMSLDNLSVALWETGRREESLSAVFEATEHYRTLAEAAPDVYRPDFADSLNTLAVRLGEVGLYEEGLSMIRLATEHYRVLAEAAPERFEAALRRSLAATAWLEGFPR